MRQLYLITCFSAIFFTFSEVMAYAPPVLDWQKCLGGSNNDLSGKIISNPNGGIWILGNVDSQNGKILSNHGSTDIWLTKMDAQGNLGWQKSIGGTSIDIATGILQVNDKLFISGYTSSNDGDIAQNLGSFDALIVCVDTTGNLLWEKTYGGSGADLIYAMTSTSDGGFIMAGGTYSNDDDVSNNHGDQDLWIIRTDVSGNMLWQKTIGGTDLDVCYSVVQDASGNIFAAGATKSVDGDITNNHGDYDCMMAKLDDSGNILWTKTYGGSSFESAQSMIITSNQEIVIGGYSRSADGDVALNYGYTDSWVLKTDLSGNILQSKVFGGSGSDNLFSIEQTLDGGFLFASGSSSADQDVYNNNGNEDVWILKTDAAMNKEWDESYGGTGNERPSSVIQISSNEYYIGGYTFSNNGDVSGNNGGSDLWILHLDCRVPVSVINSSASVICAGDSVHLNSLSQNSTRLSWMINGNVVTGDSAFIYAVTNAGTYNVTLAVATCLATDTSTLSIVANICNLPSVAFTSSVTTICSGAQVSFSNQSSNSVSYNWTFPGGNPATSTDAEPTVTYPSAGEYSVLLTATNANGTQSAMRLNYIVVNAAPQKPDIIVYGNLLNSTQASNYQWMLNSVDITNANSQSYAVLADGFYQVSVSDSNQCTATSDSVYIAINAVEYHSVNKSFELYPNPASSVVFIHSADDEKIKEIIISDLNGKTIYSSFNFAARLNSIDISQYANGIYKLTIIKTDNTSESHMFIRRS